MLLGIEPEGPAAVGGLILGDVLVAADGHSLAQPEALADLLERTPRGPDRQIPSAAGGRGAGFGRPHRRAAEAKEIRT